MQPYYEDSTVRLHHGDCLDVLAAMPANSVDAIVTDPPYGLGFMGKAWDDLPPGLLWAQECLRVLKPGGHLLAFGGTRTWHRLAVAVEDAGFEVRDSIAWLYGSGFPKSLDVSKAIDKAAGATREVVGERTSAYGTDTATGERISRTGGGAGLWVGAEPKTVPLRSSEGATPAAQQWQGWGTALKPAFEPIVVARKPLESTVAANVLEWGTGALNIDGTRTKTDEVIANHARSSASAVSKGIYGDSTGQETHQTAGQALGRWPANVVLDGSQAEALDETSDGGRSVNAPARWVGGTGTHEGWGNVGKAEPGEVRGGYGDTGGPSRYFPTFRYQAKAPTRERPRVGEVAHPTVKPLALMQWLVRLVTPPGGVVLEPFAGSGTTVEACLLEGFRCIAIEREADYLPLIEARIDRATSSPATDEDAPPTLFDATA